MLSLSFVGDIKTPLARKRKKKEGSDAGGPSDRRCSMSSHTVKKHDELLSRRLGAGRLQRRFLNRVQKKEGKTPQRNLPSIHYRRNAHIRGKMPEFTSAKRKDKEGRLSLCGEGRPQWLPLSLTAHRGKKFTADHHGSQERRFSS